MSTPQGDTTIVLSAPIEELSSVDIAQDIVKLETLSKQINSRILTYKQALLEQMKEKKVLSLKLESMTVSRVTRSTIKITDNDLLAKAIEESGNELITKTIVDLDYMKPLVTSLLKSGEVSGASLQETEYVSVRIKE